MRYIGSKTLLLENIGQIVSEYRNHGIFCDPFGGIGTVGGFMKSKGYEVIAGDILNFAHYFQIALIENNQMPKFNKIKKATNATNIEELENYFSDIIADGWFVEEYSEKRMFFTKENAMHIQACINSIWSWKEKGYLNKSEYAVLIASLVQSFDKVANTAGTYYAYLKEYYRKAQKEFKFNFIVPIKGQNSGKSKLMDASNLVQEVHCDILYLDPPYNERNYGRYYHLPETIAVGVKPVPHGKSGIYVHEDKYSEYNKKNKATDAFLQLVNSTDAECIIFHYTDAGLIYCDDVREILKPIGTLDEFYFDSKGYNTTNEIAKCQHHIFRVIK